MDPNYYPMSPSLIQTMKTQFTPYGKCPGCLPIENPDFVQVVTNWQGSPVSPVWRPDQTVGRLGPLKATSGAQDNRLLELVSFSSANLLITALNGS